MRHEPRQHSAGAIRGGLAALASIAFVLVSCSSTTTRTTVGTDTVPSTTIPVATTVPPVPSTVPETTVPAGPVDLSLRGDGIGPFTFGDTPDPLIAELNLQFGVPTFDTSREYPLDDGFGGYSTADGEFGFINLAGREVCWSIDFCAEFAGVNASALYFVGWTYYAEPGGPLQATSGVTTGSLWSDFPAMNVGTSGCYTVGYGNIGGIDLTLLSSGETFGAYDDLGNFVAVMPVPADVSVLSMTAGSIPIDGIESDC